MPPRRPKLRELETIWKELELVLHNLRRASDPHDRVKYLAEMRLLLEEADRTTGLKN